MINKIVTFSYNGNTSKFILQINCLTTYASSFKCTFTCYCIETSYIFHYTRNKFSFANYTTDLSTWWLHNIKSNVRNPEVRSFFRNIYNNWTSIIKFLNDMAWISYLHYFFYIKHVIFFFIHIENAQSLASRMLDIIS